MSKSNQDNEDMRLVSEEEVVPGRYSYTHYIVPRLILLAVILLLTFASFAYFLSPATTNSKVATNEQISSSPVLPVSSNPVEGSDSSPIPPFAQSSLDSVPCIPRVCKLPKRFISSDRFTLLASYPGSGNTWTRTILEEGTRVWTGSVYTDMSLIRDGFQGERMDSFATSTCPTSVIKTHYPYYFYGGLRPKTTGVVLILRSPFDAILAEFSRLFGTGASHRSKVSEETLVKNFPSRFERGIQKWKKYASFWLSTWNSSDTRVTLSHDVLSFELTSNQHLFRHPVPVQVMFYEHFVRNFPEATHRLFSKLKTTLGNQIPTSAQEAVVCVTAKKAATSKEQRKHAEDEYNIFTDPQRWPNVRRVVQRACEEWKPYWFEQVWGPCESAIFPQVKRLPVVQDSLNLADLETCAGSLVIEEQPQTKFADDYEEQDSAGDHDALDNPEDDSYDEDGSEEEEEDDDDDIE